MDGLIRTKHFYQHFRQRGITDDVIQAILYYGERCLSRNGVESLIFTKAALVEIKSDLGSAVFMACEKRRNAYLIVSEEGALITVACSYRKAIH